MFLIICGRVEEMLPDFHSYLPPAISVLGGKTWVCPGWQEVPEGTTLDEVYEKWTQYKPEMEELVQESIKEKVLSSKGDKEYTVVCNNGIWNCDCVGFGFRRTCSHIEQVKKKHRI